MPIEDITLRKWMLSQMAYTDVLECNGPSMPSDEVYMHCYRFWYPFGHQAQLDREWDEGLWER